MKVHNLSVIGAHLVCGPLPFIQAASSGIVESIMNWVKFKAQTQLNQKCSAVKHTKIKGVPKLDDANSAGTSSTLHPHQS